MAFHIIRERKVGLGWLAQELHVSRSDLFLTLPIRMHNTTFDNILLDEGEVHTEILRF